VGLQREGAVIFKFRFFETVLFGQYESQVVVQPGVIGMQTDQFSISHFNSLYFIGSRREPEDLRPKNYVADNSSLVLEETFCIRYWRTQGFALLVHPFVGVDFPKAHLRQLSFGAFILFSLA